MQSHRETLAHSRAAVEALLRQGNLPATEIARRAQVSRMTVERVKRAMGVRTNRDARTAMMATATTAELDELRSLVQQLHAKLDREREEHQRTYQRERRKDQELRDTRKGDVWSQKFGDLGYSVYDLLPEQAWHVLLEGSELPVEFRCQRIDAVDRKTVLVLTDRARAALREVVAVRETMATDDDHTSIDERASRDRFMRQLRLEFYGDDDPSPVAARQRKPTKRR